MIWTPDPTFPATGREDCRLLVGVESPHGLYVLVEGPPPNPLPRPGDDPGPVGNWLVQVSSPAGDLVFRRGGASESDREHTVITARFDLPSPDVDALDVTVELDGEPVMRARAIRRRDSVDR
jgi:hypothetical protein